MAPILPPEIMGLIEDEEDNEWGCGCEDYHYADCPTRSSEGSAMSKDDWLDYYATDPEELY